MITPTEAENRKVEEITEEEDDEDAEGEEARLANYNVATEAVPIFDSWFDKSAPIGSQALANANKKINEQAEWKKQTGEEEDF